jgi:tRNA (adenine-N(1)-)-methyltransferase non-catalytic subunit
MGRVGRIALREIRQLTTSIVLATELSPISILARLSPYLMGSSQIVIYSPYLPILSEVLAHTRKSTEYLNPTITESWSRTYQVLPGRTHPLMMTSGTGGYLFHATKIFPSTYQAESNQHFNRKKARGGNRPKAGEGEDEEGEGEENEDEAFDEALDATQEDVVMDS